MYGPKSHSQNGAGEARPYEPEKNPAIRRITAGAIKRRKGKAIFPIATAYDAPFGQFVEDAGIDADPLVHDVHDQRTGGCGTDGDDGGGQGDGRSAALAELHCHA